MIQRVLTACERAALLTRRLLSYAGKDQSTVAPANLAELVRDLGSLLRTSIPKLVNLSLELDEDLPPVLVDEAQLQQVVMNLVINGAEAIGENKTGVVEIRVAPRQIGKREALEFFGSGQAEGTYVMLEVKDTGSGMDEDTKARIFDPFFSTKFAGRGLGLAEVQGIVKAHKGSINVYSIPGRGSSFLILLPAQREKLAPEKEKDLAASSIPYGTVVLVVDDEDVVRKVSNAALVQAGAKVMVAENGKAGVELFRQHHSQISVTILDLQMPVMGGEEAMRIMREIDREVPVILSSGFDDRATRFRCG